MNTGIAAISLPVLILGIAMGIAQLALLVSALWILIKTDVERLTLPRLAWVAIIVFVNLLGPIAFLIGGRKRDLVQPHIPGAQTASAKDAVDSLYR